MGKKPYSISANSGLLSSRFAGYGKPSARTQLQEVEPLLGNKIQHPVPMKTVFVSLALMLTGPTITLASQSVAVGKASWYGEAHRGRLMANGQRFDPDKLTAASWFYPLGTKVRVVALDRSSDPKIKT